MTYLYPAERERQQKRDAMMDNLARAVRRADFDDWEFWHEGQPTEVYMRTFFDVTWDEGERGPFAVARIIGAEFGNILIDRDTLDAAFPGEVAGKEKRIGKQFTQWGKAE